MSTAIVPQQAKPPIEVGQRGLTLKTLEDMYRFSQYVAASGLAPKGLERPEAILVALEYGLELGLSPAQSLQNIAVINGRPSIWGDSMLALCMGSEAWDSEVFHEWFSGQPGTDEFAAHCRVGRRGRKEPIERSFSIGQAKRAGLWGQAGPWKQYPERMLQMRARSWALRDAFPDVLRGCLSAEEVMDIPPEAPPQPRGVAALAGRLGVPAIAQPEPIPDGGHGIVAEAAAREVAAGPNGTIPPVGEAATAPKIQPPAPAADAHEVDQIMQELGIS